MSFDQSTFVHFRLWPGDFSGLLYDDRDERFRSLVFGWDTTATGCMATPNIPPQGAVWGFVQEGEVVIDVSSPRPRVVGAGEFFVTANGARLRLDSGTRLFAVQQIGFRAVPVLGGPIEARGRLRYIDGCSDSLLVSPPVLGEPCLNHLHFPPGISQTRHTHPSLRAGIVARGKGSCRTPDGEVALTPGSIFVIRTDGEHGFHTETDSMDVIAYHPDSDFGPQHENHPMINRTLVGGEKLDNRGGRHAKAEIIESHFPVDSVERVVSDSPEAADRAF